MWVSLGRRVSRQGGSPQWEFSWKGTEGGRATLSDSHLQTGGLWENVRMLWTAAGALGDSSITERLETVRVGGVLLSAEQPQALLRRDWSLRGPGGEGQGFTRDQALLVCIGARSRGHWGAP